MAKARKDLFNKQQQDLAELAKALSHPARIAILEHLAARNVCVCGELVDVVPLSQATVSQHLKVLKDARLVTGQVDGPKSCYCVDWAKLKSAQEAIASWFEKAEALNTCC